MVPYHTIERSELTGCDRGDELPGSGKLGEAVVHAWLGKIICHGKHGVHLALSELL